MNEAELSVKLPEPSTTLSQDEEYCIVVNEGKKQKIRFHDYPEIYNIPGLYEHLIYETLKCNSPKVVSSLLVDEVNQSSLPVSDLIVLDLGAGNGMVGEVLAKKGVKKIVGVDIIEEAAQATERDRPNLYHNYYVEDMNDLSQQSEEELKATNFNCMVCVAALGFGDIPPAVFGNAYNLVDNNGWVAFTIKKDFVDKHEDTTGFSKLIRNLTEDGRLDIQVKHPYRHRLSVDGKPLEYLAMIGRKRTDIPQNMLQ
jgi:2-polyprenyl-3-methyl-5-hydroxy-6-metoxy-1,4-benzoquinol methylase